MLTAEPGWGYIGAHPAILLTSVFGYFQTKATGENVLFGIVPNEYFLFMLISLPFSGMWDQDHKKSSSLGG